MLGAVAVWLIRKLVAPSSALPDPLTSWPRWGFCQPLAPTSYRGLGSWFGPYTTVDAPASGRGAVWTRFSTVVSRSSVRLSHSDRSTARATRVIYSPRQHRGTADQRLNQCTAHL